MKSLLFFAILFHFSAWGSEHFLPLRKDYHVPSHCQEVELDHFSRSISWFTAGRKGAEDFGFTMEVPLDRKDATTLWKFMTSIAHDEPDFEVWPSIREDKEIYDHYRTLMAHHKGMGVDFGNEGDVLEVLIIEELRRRYPAPEYFVTGGIEYSEGAGTRTIGEIDVMIADGRTCEALMIGEVKLGSGRALSKARSQLSRFSNFLEDRGAPGLKEEMTLQKKKSCDIPAAL